MEETMTITGQKKISIYDPLTGIVVQLNNIAEQGEFVDNPSFIRDSKGGRMFAGDDHKAEFMALDGTGYDQLETWMKDRTKVQFVTYGLDEHILWYEDTYITVKRNSPFSPYKRSGFVITFERQGGVHSIYKGKNIFYSVYNWKDADNDQIADGFSIAVSSGSVNKNFAASVQVVQAITTAVFRVDNSPLKLLYPISGVQLQMYEPSIINTDSLKYQISGHTFADALLGNNIGIIGDNGVTFTTSANVYGYYIYIVTDLQQLAAGNEVQFQFPYIGVPGTANQIIKY